MVSSKSIHAEFKRLLKQCQSESSVVGQGDRLLLTDWLAEWIQSPWPWTVYHYDCVSSTNQVLWELVQKGQGEHVVAIATRQTGGKGQWARQWHSPPGGLYLSAALSLEIPVHVKGTLTLAIAWGIARLLDAVGIPVRLKWPNDLVIRADDSEMKTRVHPEWCGDGSIVPPSSDSEQSLKKLGGILIETRVRGDRITQAVIGVGVNWRNSVPDTGISLNYFHTDQSMAPIQSLDTLAALVLLGIQVGVERWQQEGARAIALAYESFWVNQGQWIEVPLDEDTLAWGEIVGVTPSGNLRLCIPSEHGNGNIEMAFAPGTIQVGYGR